MQEKFIKNIDFAAVLPLAEQVVYQKGKSSAKPSLRIRL